MAGAPSRRVVPELRTEPLGRPTPPPLRVSSVPVIWRMQEDTADHRRGHRSPCRHRLRGQTIGADLVPHGRHDPPTPLSPTVFAAAHTWCPWRDRFSSSRCACTAYSVANTENTDSSRRTLASGERSSHSSCEARRLCPDRSKQTNQRGGGGKLDVRRSYELLDVIRYNRP